MKLAGLQSEMRHGMKFVFAVLFVALSLASGVDAQIPCSYEVSAIIQAPPGQFGLPSPTLGDAISPNGRYVCGRYLSGGFGDYIAFVYDTKTSRFTSLPNPPGISLIWDVADVNDAGVVVGEHGGSAGDFGFIYDLSTGQYTELPSLSPDGRCGINAINNAGMVCGFRSLDDGGDPVNPWNAFIWSAKDGFTDLGVMNGPFSTARDINDNGVVVGNTGTANTSSATRAFVYESGIVTVLGPVPMAVNSTAGSIDNDRRILMGGTIQQTPTVGVVYVYQNGTYKPLPPLDGYPALQVRGMNNTEIVVGNSGNSDIGMTPTAWISELPVDLNQLVQPIEDLYIHYATAVSDDGRIITHATDPIPVIVLLAPDNPKVGDTNCDAVVDVDDLLNVINDWGKCAGCTSDLTQDEIVDLDDLIQVLDNWSF